VAVKQSKHCRNCADTVFESVCVPIHLASSTCFASVAACWSGTFESMYGNGGIVVYMHRIAGSLHAVALCIMIRCWMMNNMDMFDTLAAATSTAGMVLLNTVSSEQLNNVAEHTRQQARALVTVCYLFIFSQWARAVWPSGDAGETECRQRCCRWSELFYGMTVFLATTLMFFGSMLAVSAWNQTPNKGIDFGITAAATVSVLAVFMLVTGVTLLIVAVSHNPVSLLCPFPYLIGGAAIALVSVPTPSPVLLIWQRFVPAWMYCSSVAWPVVLHSTNHLQTSTMWFALWGNVGIVLGCRLLMVQDNGNKTQRSGDLMMI